jgi:hypothetical protein
VPTIRFQVLYVFLVLAHDRRRILHFNVTTHPTAEWTGRQLREAFPFDQLPRYLLRDRDAIFGMSVPLTRPSSFMVKRGQERNSSRGSFTISAPGVLVRS